jgi:hypothetical protein
MPIRHRTIVILLLSAAIGLPAGARAQNDNNVAVAKAGTASQEQVQVPQPEQGVNWKGVGIGAGTLASNVFYIPAKLVYGILGGIAGGAGYALTGGNKEVADTIWRSSLGGDYVVTPDMVSGKEPVHFSGPTDVSPMSSSPTSESAPKVSSNAAAAPSASSNPAAEYSSPSMSSSSIPAASGTHPMDSGTGPVKGAPNHSVSVHDDGAISGNKTDTYGASTGTSHKRSLLPDTTIE